MRWGYAAALLMAAVVLGCSADKRAGVEGKVTYDGQPLDVGTITFIPTGGAGDKSGGLIDGGVYRVEAKTGPAPGPHKVEIRWAKPTGKSSKNEFGEVITSRQEGLPDKYHANSTLTAEVKAGKNVIDFALEK